MIVYRVLKNLKRLFPPLKMIESWRGFESVTDKPIWSEAWFCCILMSVNAYLVHTMCKTQRSRAISAYLGIHFWKWWRKKCWVLNCQDLRGAWVYSRPFISSDGMKNRVKLRGGLAWLEENNVFCSAVSTKYKHIPTKC